MYLCQVQFTVAKARDIKKDKQRLHTYFSPRRMVQHKFRMSTEAYQGTYICWDFPGSPCMEITFPFHEPQSRDRGESHRDLTGRVRRSSSDSYTSTLGATCVIG